MDVKHPKCQQHMPNIGPLLCLCLPLLLTIAMLCSSIVTAYYQLRLHLPLLLLLVLLSVFVSVVAINSSDSAANYLYCWCKFLRWLLLPKTRERNIYRWNLCYSWCFFDWVEDLSKPPLLLSLKISKTFSYWVWESLKTLIFTKFENI